MEIFPIDKTNEGTDRKKILLNIRIFLYFVWLKINFSLVSINEIRRKRINFRKLWTISLHKYFSGYFPYKNLLEKDIEYTSRCTIQ